MWTLSQSEENHHKNPQSIDKLALFEKPAFQMENHLLKFWYIGYKSRINLPYTLHKDNANEFDISI